MTGNTPAPASSVTVNGLPAQAYADFTFASLYGYTLADGQNSFTNVAANYYGTASVTNIVTANLPASLALQYDANGNLTNDGSRSFSYDAENQLTNVNVTGQWRSDFLYDGLGRRRIEHDYTWHSGAWALTNEVRYLFDEMVVMQELDSNNVAQVTYTRGIDFSGSFQGAGGIGGLLARTDANGSTFYHADGSGNVTALMDSAGYMAARYLYDPFGRLLGKWGRMAESNRIRFSSKELHTQSGLYYYGFRFYDPELQRWLNHDPLAEFGGLNLFRFIANNPISHVDPMGLFDPITTTAAGVGVTTTITSSSGGAGVTLTVVGGTTAEIGLGPVAVGILLGGGAAYVLGEAIGISRDAEFNPTGVNGPPGTASSKLLVGYTVGSGEYRDQDGNVRNVAGDLVRDPSGRDISSGEKPPCPGKAPATPTSLDPAIINFSQRTVNQNVLQYTEDMRNNEWDWDVSGPLRVMLVNGQWVSYDNRRLMAAQNAGFASVPVQVVQPSDVAPGGSTWGELFNARLNHAWNIENGGPVPSTGLESQPSIFRRDPGN